MLIEKEKFAQIKGEKPQYDERFDKRQFKSKYQQDIIKGIVEIIKNGVDAYLNERGEDQCNKERIDVILESINRKNDFIKIINYAEGMNGDKFTEAMKVGADTSSDKKSVTGAHGYGMKEAAWAFQETRIITIRNGFYSSRLFYWDEKDLPKYAWDKNEEGNDAIDSPVTDAIRKKTGIENDGTYFEAIIPDHISCPARHTCHNQLNENILLRTINQSEKFEILLGERDKSGKLTPFNVIYNPPPILALRPDRTEHDLGEFSFEYPGYGIINCKYVIYLSKTELSHTGENREAGILVCAGPFTVLDCTLFDLGSKVASRFFGKVILTGEIRSICKNEKILEEKRESGLIKKTPLYQNLYKRFHKKLEDLIEAERRRLNKTTREVSRKLLDNKIDLIKEFNKIDREETDESTELKGDLKFDPGENGIRFCVPNDYIKLIERQTKNVHIAIDTTTIPIGSEIEIQSNKEGIDYNPITFVVTKQETDSRDVFKKKISFTSDIVDTYQITATVKDMFNKAELYIDVFNDPRLKIKNPIEFIPNEQDIVAGKEKKVPLIIDFSRIDTNENIEFETDTRLFNIHKRVKIQRDSVQIWHNYYELMIPIYCSGKPGQKGNLKVKIGSDTAVLKLNIIHKKDRFMKGDFHGIKNDEDMDPESLGYYEPEEKIIYVCRNHPILRHYRSGKGAEKNITYRLLYSDVIIREFCKALSRKKIPSHENMGAEDFRVRFDREYDKLYKKHSIRLHRFCINPKNIEMIKAD